MGRLGAVFLVAVLCLAAPARGQESTEPPPPRAAPVSTVVAEELPRAGGVLVFGADDPLGLEIAKQLVAAGKQVTAVVPTEAAGAALRAANVPTVTASARVPDQVKAAFTSAPFRLVVSIYDTRAEEADMGFEGSRNVVDATKAVGVPRLLMIDTIGAGDSAAAVPWYIKLFRPNVATGATQAEAHLKAAQLDYTIVRSGWRLDESATGQAVLDERVGVFTWISNADLARLVIGIFGSTASSGKTLTAVEPTRTSIFSVIF